MTALLVEYVVTKEQTLLFLVAPGMDQPQVERIPLGADELRSHVSRVRSAAETEAALTAGDALAALIAPLERASAPGDTLWFVPHDVIHYLPLSALPIAGKPLAERNPSCVTPGASTMRYCRAKRRTGTRRVVIYADSCDDRPLPRARKQAISLSRRFGQGTVLRLGPDTTSMALLEDMRGEGTRILHLGCHGSFLPAEPLASGVLLADGFLTAKRILGMSLPADLVTLSACESGVNAYHSGDELIGLTRALLYAGAASVLASLWPVDELSTSLLMEEFYREIADGTPKAESLRRAQLCVRSMSATEVIRRCQESMDAGSAIEEDIAYARFRCGDYAGARDTYAHLLGTTQPGSPEYQKLKIAEARSRRAAAAAAATADYDRAIYHHPYHWASFILVGDWK